MSRSLWDCVDPCAMLVMCCQRLPGLAANRDVLKTLDNYGWLTEVRQPDVARARRQLEQAKASHEIMSILDPQGESDEASQ